MNTTQDANRRGFPTPTLADLRQWVENDEALYMWQQGSGKSLATFVRANRDALSAYVIGRLNEEPTR